MTGEDRNRKLAEVVAGVLDEQTDRIPAPLLARLARSRVAAVELSERRRRHRTGWITAGGLATAVAGLAAVLLLWSPDTGREHALPAEQVEEIEALGSHNADLYRDLDFYQWLAASEGKKGTRE